MIVPDTNILVDFFVGESRFHEAAKSGHMKDPVWVGPSIWRYEFGNVLLSYVRKEFISHEMMENFSSQSELLVKYTVDEINPIEINQIALRDKFSFYDATYIWLAQKLGIKLWTRDKQILRAYPHLAVSLL